jgi:hypothetical protein
MVLMLKLVVALTLLLTSYNSRVTVHRVNSLQAISTPRSLTTGHEFMGSPLGGQDWRKLHVSDLLTGSQEMPSNGGRMNTDILARGAPRPGYCRYQVFGADI